MPIQRRHMYKMGQVNPVGMDEWNTTQTGELILATYRDINSDTRLELYALLTEYHLTDPNLHLLKPIGDSLFTFTPESALFLKSILAGSPHNAVKAAVLCDLIQGYFNVTQSIRYARLRGRGLVEQWKTLDNAADGRHVANVEAWDECSPDDIEREARYYAKLGNNHLRRERLYECRFDDDGTLFRTLLTTLGGRVDVLTYQMDHFCIGKQVKDEVFTTLEGRAVSLRDRCGKVALVDIWSTSCMPCRIKLPELMELQRRLESQPFEIITLNVDKSRDTLDAFVESPEFVYVADRESQGQVREHPQQHNDDLEFTLPVAHIGMTSPLIRRWDINGYPTLILLDADGVMHARGHHIPYDNISEMLPNR